MEPIFSMTTLQRSPSSVKEAAQSSVVRITEQGKGAYIFASEEAFERRIAEERAESAYEARLVESVGRGVDDIAAGRYFSSIDQAFAEAQRRRQACA